MPLYHGWMTFGAPRGLRRCLIALAATSSMCLVAAAVAPLPARAAACSTADPAANFTGSTLTFEKANPDNVIEENFNKARAAEGCTTPLVLPAGFDALSPQQQALFLMNAEREARGLAPLKLDSTLMSQVTLNHSQEMAKYGYFAHPSPINQGSNISKRETVNPALAQPFPSLCCAENISAGTATAASAIFGFMYEDSASGWGHRHNILQSEDNWVGIGVLLGVEGSVWKHYWTLDFAKLSNYVPPATADTNPPVVGPVSFANGTITVTGVEDSPLNVNDKGATPASAGITSVVFYVNSIVENATTKTFNTVVGTQTAPGSGTWTAPIEVPAGGVLHAVAVDGSGNFTDMTPPMPPMPLEPGPNMMAVPPAGEPPVAIEPPVEPIEFPVGGEVMEFEPIAFGARHLRGRASRSAMGGTAAMPTAGSLVASVDKQLKRDAVKDVRIFVNGHWRVYIPPKPHREDQARHTERPHRSEKARSASESHDMALNAGEGVILDMNGKGSWRPPAGRQRYVVPAVELHAGWNLVAAPYPMSGLTCDTIADGLARSGVELLQVTLGAAPIAGTKICLPGKGALDNDEVISSDSAFWVKSSGAATWYPNTYDVSNGSGRVIK
jgi:uncharacterized protein YkwD